MGRKNLTNMQNDFETKGYSEVTRQIAATINEQMKINNKTGRQLAQMLSKNKNTISHYRNGEHLSISVLNLLAKKLKFSVELYFSPLPQNTIDEPRTKIEREDVKKNISFLLEENRIKLDSLQFHPSTFYRWKKTPKDDEAKEDKRKKDELEQEDPILNQIMNVPLLELFMFAQTCNHTLYDLLLTDIQEKAKEEQKL